MCTRETEFAPHVATGVWGDMRCGVQANVHQGEQWGSTRCEAAPCPQRASSYQGDYQHMHHADRNGANCYGGNSVPPQMLEPSAAIVDVWADSLEWAFERIREVVVDYPYIAMDTEFPGIVARPVGNFKTNTEFYYQTLRCNVNLLKIIQLGITFANEHGQHPPGPCTWQFNFRFNLTDDIYAQDSIDLLTTSGIDFARFATEGIEVSDFAELFISSGLVLAADPPVRWLSFHSGYDFGYLLKVLTCSELPANETEFTELMSIYFPEVFDVKFLLKQTGGALVETCGLNKLADSLMVHRIGPAHQAGSDSLLTCHCFFQLAHDYFPGGCISKYTSVLYGLGQDSEDWSAGSCQQSTDTVTDDTWDPRLTGARLGAVADSNAVWSQSRDCLSEPNTPQCGEPQPRGHTNRYFVQQVVWRGTHASSVRNM